MGGLSDMPPVDLASGLPDLDADAPAGSNLEFDAAFGELERAAQGKPEQQYGGTIIPAEDPDWKDVAAQSERLLDRTYDLRVLVLLATARLHLKGVAEFFSVIGAIRQLLQDRWPHVHPQLDPDDDNDPTFRANALLPLADPIRVLRLLRTMPLAASRRDGPVSWRTIGIFNGVIDTEDPAEKKTEAVIRAAFNDTGAGVVQARLEMFDAGIAELTGIEAAFDANAGYGNGPDLSNLAKLLREISSYLRNYMPASDDEFGSDAAGDLPSDGGGVEDGGASGPPRPGSARSGGVSIASLTAINSREDAMKLLDLVCRYYETHEPSSPLPLLVARARRLADKGFIEILQDMAPDGLSQAQNVVGRRDE